MSDFSTIIQRYSRDPDLSQRAYTLTLLQMVLNQTLYDVLLYKFHEEKNTSGEYVPLHLRQPCIRYGLGLLRGVVEDSIMFTFGEGRFPMIDADTDEDRDLAAAVIKECKLVQVMRDAGIRGSIGSVAIQMRVLKNRLFFNVLDTINLIPTYDPSEPDKLIKITEKYKVLGKDLIEQGYTISADERMQWFWFQRIFDANSENWYLPWPTSDEKAKPRIDNDRSVTHNLGFVPFVWIKNLPGHMNDIDGCSTFGKAIDTAIRIDYQLSQADRGLKYSADPTLLIKEPAQADGKIIRSASNAIVVDKDGDAKLLEIGGTASAAQLDFVKALREFLLESIKGNRANADRISAAQSGRAMELLYHPLIMLADHLRASYGEDGLLSLMKMVFAACNKLSIRVNGELVGGISDKPKLSLRWPNYFPATPHDLSLQAPTLAQLKEAGMLSQETAVKVISPVYDIEDPAAELTKIKADAEAETQRAMELAAQTKATLPLDATG